MTERLSDIQRVHLARKLFQQAERLTNPEVIAAFWNNLSPEDRQLWLDRVDQGMRPDKEEV